MSVEATTAIVFGLSFIAVFISLSRKEYPNYIHDNRTESKEDSAKH
jgi:multisubunit Na+/H+ antiporter MnhC subunit